MLHVRHVSNMRISVTLGNLERNEIGEVTAEETESAAASIAASLSGWSPKDVGSSQSFVTVVVNTLPTPAKPAIRKDGGHTVCLALYKLEQYQPIAREKS